MHLRVRGRTTIVAGYSVSGAHFPGEHRPSAAGCMSRFSAMVFDIASTWGRAAACFRADPSFPVVIGAGSHPFPFRTRKLSLFPPMVLRA
jgi:hypothetical protein